MRQQRDKEERAHIMGVVYGKTKEERQRRKEREAEAKELKPGEPAMGRESPEFGIGYPSLTLDDVKRAAPETQKEMSKRLLVELGARVSDTLNKADLSGRRWLGHPTARPREINDAVDFIERQGWGDEPWVGEVLRDPIAAHRELYPEWWAAKEAGKEKAEVIQLPTRDEREAAEVARIAAEIEAAEPGAGLERKKGAG